MINLQFANAPEKNCFWGYDINSFLKRKNYIKNKGGSYSSHRLYLIIESIAYSAAPQGYLAKRK